MLSPHARTALGVAPGLDHSEAVAHVETLRRGWDAFNVRDFAGAVQYLHPDGAAFPAARQHNLRGRAEVRRFLERVSYAWQRVTVELREVVVAPDGRLLAVEGWHLQGRDGIELETMVITVYAFRDGLVGRLDGFLDRARALEKIGRPQH